MSSATAAGKPLTVDDVVRVLSGGSKFALYTRAQPAAAAAGAAGAPANVQVPGSGSSSGSGAVIKTAIFMFYRSGPRAGSFYWCDASLSAIPDLASLPSFTLRDITDLFLDKQTAELQSALASAARDDACCTIVSKKFTLNLECDSPQTRSFWVDGISMILSSAGKAVVKTGGADVPPPPATAAGAATATGATKPPPPPPTGQTKPPPAPIVSLPLSEPEQRLVDALKAGHTFLLYGTTATINVQLCYRPDETKAGSLYYRSVGSTVDLRIPLHTITDVYVGKELMPAKLAQSAPEECSFSIVSPTVSLHLQADAKETLETWLNGLHVVLTSKGKKVAVDNDTGAAAQKSKLLGLSGGSAASPRTSTLMGATPLVPATGSAAASASAAAAASQSRVQAPGSQGGTKPTSGGAGGSQQSPRTMIAAPTSNDTAWIEKAASRGIAIRMMIDGSPFYLYTAPGKRDAITLCYRRDETSAGSLYWKKVSSGSPSSGGGAAAASVSASGEYDVSRRQPLHKITDVFMGKELTAPTAGGAAAAASAKAKTYFLDATPEAQCVSIMNLDRRCLQLEASAPEVLDAWLAGINYLLTNSGRRVVEDATNSTAAASAAAASATNPATASPMNSAAAAAAAAATAAAAHNDSDADSDAYSASLLSLNSLLSSISPQYQLAADRMENEFRELRRQLDDRQQKLMTALKKARDAKILALQTQLQVLERASDAKDPVSRHSLTPAATASFSTTVSITPITAIIGAWKRFDSDKR